MIVRTDYHPNAECGTRNAECRFTRHAPRSTLHAPRSTRSALRAFTLLELLTVIAIMGIVAALSLPTLRGLKPNAKVAATRDLLDAVGRARQLAISQRTTVYMVFVPTNFFSGLTITNGGPLQSLLDKQLIGYAYVCLRSVGDQPGAHNARYLSPWRTLPKGAYIPMEKFSTGLTIANTGNLALGNGVIPPFAWTNTIPFPSEDFAVVPYPWLPYIAFNGMGELVSGLAGQPELIPLTEGIVSIARNLDTKEAVAQSPLVNEVPAGNTLNNYSLVYIDRLTGRAHVERRKVQ